MKSKISSSEILVNEIRFVRKNAIHLFGFINTDSTYKPTRFVCNQKLLYALLCQNGKTGREIIALLRQALSEPHTVPLCVDLVDRFGTTLPLKAQAIQMQIPFHENGFEVSRPETVSELLFIEQIVPFPAA